MMEPADVSDEPTAANGEASTGHPRDARTEALELRVRRLEDAVALLQDTRPLEERVTERVSSRLRGTATSKPESAKVIVDAGRTLLPAALNLMKSGAEEAERQARSAAPETSRRRPWLLFDLYAEARASIRMFFDPGYRTTWQVRVFPPVLLVAILTSWIWLPGTTLLPGSLMMLVDKTVDLVLAFVGFKILSREARRYRESKADAGL